MNLEVVLTTQSCQEVYGDLTVALDDAASDLGWSPAMEGELVAIRQTDAANEGIEQWLTEMRFDGVFSSSATQRPRSAAQFFSPQ